MNDLEHRIRETLAEHEHEVPDLDLDLAGSIARRARRRQALTIAGTAVVGVLVTVGAVVGVSALLRTDRGTPADLEPPAEAPIEVGRGSVRGWEWLLSASADGICVALTDAQGSETSCATEEEALALPGMPAADVLDIAVRIPRPPGPELAFVFGRVSHRSERVVVNTTSFEETPVRVFGPPSDVDGDGEDRYFVGWIAGHPYPIVPDAGVLALASDGFLYDAATLERPPWALPPFTKLVTIAAGTWERLPGRSEPQEWEIAIYRDEATGELCFGDYPGDVCGPPENPAPAWGAPWGRFETVSEQAVTHGPERSTFVWGIFEDPVTAVRVELDDGRTIEPDVYPPPADYPLPFSVFVFDYDGKVEGRVLGLDAAGDVVARRSVGVN